MADQGPTLLTAARARKLAQNIKDDRASNAVSNAILDIKAAAKRREYSVTLKGGLWAQTESDSRVEAINMLRALGYEVVPGYTSLNDQHWGNCSYFWVRISW